MRQHSYSHAATSYSPADNYVSYAFLNEQIVEKHVPTGNLFVEEPSVPYNRDMDAGEILFTAEGLAHVIERHLRRVTSFPRKSKFTISSLEIISAIKNAAHLPRIPIKGSTNFQRILHFHKQAGIDRVTGLPTNIITIITDPDNYLHTAFPGQL